MKNEPKIIHLNIGAVEGDEPQDFKECHEVTWSEEKIYQQDIKYANVGSFLSFVSRTGLYQKDKDLIRGVFYDWLSS